MWDTAFAASARGWTSEITTRASPDWSSLASDYRFSRPTFQLTNRTFLEPNRMRPARAILGNPAKSPPVLPTLLGIKTPPGASTRAVADVGWFRTLSRTRWYRSLP